MRTLLRHLLEEGKHLLHLFRGKVIEHCRRYRGPLFDPLPFMVSVSIDSKLWVDKGTCDHAHFNGHFDLLNTGLLEPNRVLQGKRGRTGDGQYSAIE
jgi:hypothetical protein